MWGPAGAGWVWRGAGEAEGGPRKIGLTNLWHPPTCTRGHLKGTPDPCGALGTQTVLGLWPLNWHQLSHHRHEGLLHLWHSMATGRQKGKTLLLGSVCPKSLPSSQGLLPLR